MPADAPALTDDAALGGRLRLLQPKRGHRFGHDAVLLAAATHARTGEHIVEFGAGVGLAALALASRVGGTRLTLIEIDATLADLARENAARNGLADRVDVITQDVTAPLGDLGSVDHVMMNPPYNDPRRHPASPDPARAGAHVGTRDTLNDWCAAAARVLKSSGTLTLIWRAEALTAVQAALTPAYGGITVIPVHSRSGSPATLVLVRAEKGSSAPPLTTRGLVLNDADNKPTAEAERILRGGEALGLE